MAVEDIKEVSETTESTKTTGNIPNSVSVGDEAKSSDMIGSNESIVVPEKVINGHTVPKETELDFMIPNAEPEKATEVDLGSNGSGRVKYTKLFKLSKFQSWIE